MEQPSDRMTFEMVFRNTLEEPMMDPETGEISTKGKVLFKSHANIERLVRKMLEMAEDK